MSAQSDSPRQSIIDDFTNVLSEAETLLKAAATETGEKARDLRSQVEAKLLHRQAAAAGDAGRGGRSGQGSRPRDGRLRARPSVAGDRHRRRGRPRRRPARSTVASSAASRGRRLLPAVCSGALARLGAVVARARAHAGRARVARILRGARARGRISCCSSASPPLRSHSRCSRPPRSSSPISGTATGSRRSPA